MFFPPLENFALPWKKVCGRPWLRYPNKQSTGKKAVYSNILFQYLAALPHDILVCRSTLVGNHCSKELFRIREYQNQNLGLMSFPLLFTFSPDIENALGIIEDCLSRRNLRKSGISENALAIARFSGIA